MNTAYHEKSEATKVSRVASHQARFIFVLLTCALLLLATCIIALCLGPVRIGVAEIVRCLLHPGDKGVPDDISEIIWQVRLPRIVLAALVGFALAASGAAFQSLLRNDLADPYILGISSGASTAAAAVALLGASAQLALWAVPCAAFAGSMAVLIVVLALSSKNGRMDSRSLLLIGVIVSAFLSAVEMAGMRFAGLTFEQIMNWLMGSLSAASWQNDIVVGVPTLVCFLVLAFLSPSMNLYAVGEESARQLGLETETFKRTLVVTATILAAAAVSVVGIIGFIGLISPHIARKLLKTPDHRYTLPIACLTGGILLVWSDTGARILLGGDMLPVGIITAFLGAPFFCYQIRKT